MGPDLKRIDKCSACDAPIVWASTSAGGKMPVDAEPTPDGNLLLLATVDRRWVAIVIGKATRQAGTRAVMGERHTSHFATCTDPERFRKPRGARKAKP